MGEVSPELFFSNSLQQPAGHTFQPGFLKEWVAVQRYQQLDIDVQIAFGTANRAGGADVNFIAVLFELVDDFVVQLNSGRVVMVGGHLQ